MRCNKKQYKRFGAYRRGDITSGQLQMIRQIVRDPNDPVTTCIKRLHEIEKRITDEIVTALKESAKNE